VNGRSLLVLDPGHGGSAVAGASSPNRGTGAGGLLEKDVALDLARRTRERLIADHTVVLTRDGDTNLSLADRAGAARNLGADIFVSLHLSGSDPAADRSDVVVAKAASSASVALGENLRRRITGVTGATGELLRADLGQLASDRHDPNTAACLVEVASLAPAERAALLADPAYRDRIADALAAAIRESLVPRPMATPQWVGARYARSAAVVTPDIDYSATSLADAAAIWVSWLGSYAQWAIGVPDAVLRNFPHAAICQLKLYNAAGELAYGTGFYIGDEVLLTCGHNFLDSDGWTTTRVEVQPAYSPRASILPSQTFTLDGSTIVHPRWRASFDATHDLAVLRVPGLPATAGVFRLANVSLAPDAGVVVCGYGKTDGTPFEEQGQRMDGAHASEADFDMVYYPIQTIGGHSGSPVFHESMVIGVHTGPRIRSNAIDAHQNRGVLLNPDKEDWIVSMAGGALSSAQSRYAVRSLTDANSPQREQSDGVRMDIARSVGMAETSLRYDLVHDDSQRINFGIGSWTGTRIADLLDTYAAYAAEQGRSDQLLAHFGGQQQFDELRARFRSQGTATTMSGSERAQLQQLGRDTDLQPAQDRQLADDIRDDLDAIGSQGNPWYPFIDGGMGAISEIAAHVLVHARHQSGGQGLRHRLAEVIAHFGGDEALGQAMVAGTVTERAFLEQLAELVVAHVKPEYREGVRRRYAKLWADWGSSDLSYYFNPSP
jgi:N-acetylmuramoyl-L-alanine amidase/V8-like Glu-specific endopeptidase